MSWLMTHSYVTCRLMTHSYVTHPDIAVGDDRNADGQFDGAYPIPIGEPLACTLAPPAVARATVYCQTLAPCRLHVYVGIFIYLYTNIYTCIYTYIYVHI